MNLSEVLPRHYVALIHKGPESSYGASFPDLPGVIAVGDTLDDVMAEARKALAFAAEDWADHTGSAFPSPRSIDELRRDAEFLEASADALLAVIPFHADAPAQAAE